jgi:hypothetical protein
MFVHTVIGKMGEKIGQLGSIVFLGTETDITLFIEPYLEGVPIGDHDPLSDVELAVLDQQGVLDVLLTHPTGLLQLDVVQNLHQVVQTDDPPPSRQPSQK